MIALSCGIKITAVHSLVLLKSTLVTDRQTDGQTELRQQHCALLCMQPHGKDYRYMPWTYTAVVRNYFFEYNSGKSEPIGTKFHRET